MTYTWKVSVLPEGDLGDALETGWDTREEAEFWLEDFYDDLHDCGLTEVALTCDGEVIYIMSLDADDSEAGSV